MCFRRNACHSLQRFNDFLTFLSLFLQRTCRVFSRFFYGKCIALIYLTLFLDPTILLFSRVLAVSLSWFISSSFSSFSINACVALVLVVIPCEFSSLSRDWFPASAVTFTPTGPDKEEGMGEETHGTCFRRNERTSHQLIVNVIDCLLEWHSLTQH